MLIHSCSILYSNASTNTLLYPLFGGSNLRSFRQEFLPRKKVCHFFGSPRENTIGRRSRQYSVLEYDIYLPGRDRDCELEVENRWLHHGDITGGPTKAHQNKREATLGFARGACGFVRQPHPSTRLPLTPAPLALRVSAGNSGVERVSEG